MRISIVIIIRLAARECPPDFIEWDGANAELEAQRVALIDPLPVQQQR